MEDQTKNAVDFLNSEPGLLDKFKAWLNPQSVAPVVSPGALVSVVVASAAPSQVLPVSPSPATVAPAVDDGSTVIRVPRRCEHCLGGNVDAHGFCLHCGYLNS